METNGWETRDIRYSNTADWSDDNLRLCDKHTFYGYICGDHVGEVFAIFKGSGKATLSFGNCYNMGHVIVKLNDKQLSLATANTPKKEITFHYLKHDVLTIQKIGVAIIKLNSLDLTCNGKF